MSKPNDEALRHEAAAAYLSMSLSTLRRLVRDEEHFPKPRKIAPRISVFYRSELDAFLSSLAKKA